MYVPRWFFVILLSNAFLVQSAYVFVKPCFATLTHTVQLVDWLDLQHRDGIHWHLWKSQVGPRVSSALCQFLINSASTALYLASLAEVGQGRTLSRVEIAAIAWGVNILSGVINTIGTKAIGAMSTFNLWWTLGGTFVLVITLLLKAPQKVCS